MKLLVTTEAEIDIREILAYTLEQWGIDQTLLYANSLEAAFVRLLESPSIGLSCDNIRVGYRKWLIEHHVIYYIVTPPMLTIIRILNQRMNAQSQLQ